MPLLVIKPCMARILFKESERIVGTAIIIALLGALLVAAIVFGWEYYQNKINGTDRNPPSTEIRSPIVAPISLPA